MYYLINHLLQPHILLLLATGVAIASLWRPKGASRRRLTVLTTVFALLFIVSTPVVTYLALGSLEWSFPPLEERPTDTQAVVVLSGYIAPTNSASTQFELGVDTLYRCLKAADVYRKGPHCAVLVSGGKVHPNGPTCADLMKEFLIRLGVRPADLIAEGSSTTTYENAVETAKILEEKGIKRIVLVTDAASLRRAMACFQRQGISDVVPCGCRYRALHGPTSLFDFLPDPRAADGLQDAFHEWLGLVWYWWQGRI